jgi:hypothetical protein
MYRILFFTVIVDPVREISNNSFLDKRETAGNFP